MSPVVIPAKAEIRTDSGSLATIDWIPALAGMTE